MSRFMSALEASSYQHPDRKGPYTQLCQATIQAMVERGIEYHTLAEHGISWAEDQDPFGHVMGQAYPHINAKCFVRLLESFHEQLKDKFYDFMAGRGISVMTNRVAMVITRVVKYPDLLISGLRIADVQEDRLSVIYSVWSVVQCTQVHESQTWIVFYNHKIGKRVTLIEEGGEYSDLHASLVERAAESYRLMKLWEEKQKAEAKGSKL